MNLETRSQRLRLVVLVGVLLMAASADAQFGGGITTYYVNAELGNDTNPGSSTFPFKTLNKALEPVS